VGDGFEMGGGGGRVFAGWKWFTYSVNEDGRTDAYLADTGTRNAAKLNLPAGLNGFSGNPSTFSGDGKRMLVSHQSSTQPGDLWIYETAAKGATQLTFSAIASLGAAKLRLRKWCTTKSFDGKIISAFLWVPYNLKRDGTNPGIVLPHGGPTGQTVDSFNRFAAALASRGYVCMRRTCEGRPALELSFRRRM